MKTAKRIVIGGRVQGVSFRASAQARAAELDVFGWIRNVPHGDVEVHAEGEPEDVEELVTFLRCGPRLARVDRIEVKDAEVAGYEMFEIRHD